jgi:hypothetical protein
VCAVCITNEFRNDAPGTIPRKCKAFLARNTEKTVVALETIIYGKNITQLAERIASVGKVSDVEQTRGNEALAIVGHGRPAPARFSFTMQLSPEPATEAA